MRDPRGGCGGDGRADAGGADGCGLAKPPTARRLGGAGERPPASVPASPPPLSACEEASDEPGYPLPGGSIGGAVEHTRPAQIPETQSSSLRQSSPATRLYWLHAANDAPIVTTMETNV